MKNRLLLSLAFLALACLSVAQGAFINEMRLTGVKKGKFALCIGVSDYTSLGKLTYAAGDAEAVAEKLISGLDFDPKKVKLLSDRKDPLETGPGIPGLEKRPPTIEEVNKQLDLLLKDPGLSKGDLFVFYFSGHGIATPKGDFLCPADATLATVEKVGLPVRNIIERFAKAGLKNVLIIADACRSGTGSKFGNELKTLGDRTNLAVMLGCAPGGRSYEYQTLGKGVFTHFLVRSLDEKENYDTTSGLLLGSVVGRKVAGRVSAYTERDYGADKQSPDVWSKKSTDVVIDLRPTESLLLTAFEATLLQQDQFDLEKFKKSLGESVSNEDVLRNLLGLFGIFIHGQDLHEMAIKVFRTLDSLGALGPRELLAYASSANSLGQVDLCDQLCNRLIKNYPSDVSSAWAVILDPRESRTYQERIRAAERIYEVEKSVSAAQNILYIRRFGQETSDEQMVEACRRFENDFGPTGRAGYYFKGYRLFYEGKGEEATDAVVAGMKVFESKVSSLEQPPYNDFLRQFYEILVRYGKRDQRIRIAQIGATKTNQKVFWQGILDLEQNGESAADAPVQAMIDSATTADQLLSAVEKAGQDAPKFLEEVKKKVKDKFSGTWRGLVAQWICEQDNKFTFPFPFGPEIEKYAPSDRQFKAQAYRSIYRVLRRAEINGKIGESRYQKITGAMLGDLINEIDTNREDPDVWRVVNLLARASRRFGLAALVAADRVVPLILSGKASAELSREVFDLINDYGDWNLAGQIYAKLPNTDESREAGLGLAVNLAFSGDVSKSKTVLRLLSQPLREDLEKVKRATLAYIAAVEGNQALAKSGLTALASEEEEVLIQIRGHIKLRLGDQQGYLDLVNKMSDSDYRFHAVHALTLKMLQSYFYALGKEKDLKDADNLTTIIFEDCFCVAYDRLQYGNPASVKDFAGAYKWQGNLEIDAHTVAKNPPPASPVLNLELTIEESGAVSGKLSGMGKEATIKGNLSATGTLIAIEQGGANPFILVGKIPNSAYRGTKPHLKEFKQRLQVFTKDGSYATFVEK